MGAWVVINACWYKQVAIGHVRPALDAGFIVTHDTTSHERDHYLDRRMTWAGREFIQTDRNSKICPKMRDCAEKLIYIT